MLTSFRGTSAILPRLVTSFPQRIITSEDKCALSFRRLEENGSTKEPLAMPTVGWPHDGDTSLLMNLR